MLSLCDALADARLFGVQFADASWLPWRVVLAALEGRALDGDGLRALPRVYGPADAA